MADQIQVVEQPSSQDVTAASGPLLWIKTAFPLDLFPDEVVVDRFKIDVVKKHFFWDKETETIPLSGTVTVNVNRTPFFSSVQLHDPFTDQTATVDKLWNKDAENLRKLVLGLVVGIRQGADFMNMETDEVIKNALNWGALEKVDAPIHSG